MLRSELSPGESGAEATEAEQPLLSSPREDDMTVAKLCIEVRWERSRRAGLNLNDCHEGLGTIGLEELKLGEGSSSETIMRV